MAWYDNTLLFKRAQLRNFFFSFGHRNPLLQQMSPFSCHMIDWPHESSSHLRTYKLNCRFIIANKSLLEWERIIHMYMYVHICMYSTKNLLLCCHATLYHPIHYPTRIRAPPPLLESHPHLCVLIQHSSKCHKNIIWGFWANFRLFTVTQVQKFRHIYLRYCSYFIHPCLVDQFSE